jgi:glc operon protein GlcG
MYQQPQLSHHDAMKIINTLRQQLEANGQGATIAVVDAHGELMALMRTDGSSLPAIQNAIHKAFTAAREGIESGELGARARAEGWSLTNFGDIRYTGWGGGVPIQVAGVTVGAVGVSGLPEAQDVELARQGAALVAA